MFSAKKLYKLNNLNNFDFALFRIIIILKIKCLILQFGDVFKELDIDINSNKLLLNNGSRSPISNILRESEYRFINETDTGEIYHKNERIRISKCIVNKSKFNSAIYNHSVVNRRKASLSLKSGEFSSCCLSNSDHRTLLKSIFSLNKNLEKAECMLNDQEIKDKIKKQWQMMAKVIDRVLMIVFVLFTIITLTGIIMQAPNAKFYKVFY